MVLLPTGGSGCSEHLLLLAEKGTITVMPEGPGGAGELAQGKSLHG